MTRADSATSGPPPHQPESARAGPYSPGQAPPRWSGTCSAIGGSTIPTSSDLGRRADGAAGVDVEQMVKLAVHPHPAAVISRGQPGVASKLGPWLLESSGGTPKLSDAQLVEIAASSWSTVADVLGFRFSASSCRNRSRIRSASRRAFGPADTVTSRSCRFFVTGSMPAYTRTRRAPLASVSMLPARGPRRLPDVPPRREAARLVPHLVPRDGRQRSDESRCRRSGLEPGVGLEPTTYRLQGGCSTN